MKLFKIKERALSKIKEDSDEKRRKEAMAKYYSLNLEYANFENEPYAYDVDTIILNHLIINRTKIKDIHMPEYPSFFSYANCYELYDVCNVITGELSQKTSFQLNQLAIVEERLNNINGINKDALA